MCNSQRRRLGVFLCVSIAAIALPMSDASADDRTLLPEMVVTGTREGQAKAETPSSVSVIPGTTIESVKPAHPSELMTRVPGAVVMPTTGEGSIVGVRQPIGTSPVYLYLEDGIPIRATGFFNHNALYEVNLPQAGDVEVIRGPGTALQGSDAIGAVFNVMTKAPPTKPEAAVTAEAGSHGWARGLVSAGGTWGDVGARGDLNLTHTDGWRDATGYDRQSAGFRTDVALSGDASIKAAFAATNIDQATGANSYLSRADYNDSPTTNYTPVAFRKVQALRGSLSLEHEGDRSLTTLTPYTRWNRMELLPSWMLGYDPVVYTTGHSSLGLQAKYRHDLDTWRTRLVTGIDLDYSPGFHDEDRIGRTKSGNVYTSWTRGQKMYEYDVTFSQASPYLHAETSPVANLRVTGGLRYDAMSFDYDNQLATGAFTPGFGTFYRPASTTRYYSHLSPSLGGTYAFRPDLNGFVNYKHSFRAPGEGDLFRQGTNADSIHLKPIKVDSYELGLRGPDKGDLGWEVSAYHMVKRDDVLTVSRGTAPTSTNNGRTHHTGIEAAVSWKFLPDWRIGATGGYAEHTYEKWVARDGAANVDYGGKDLRNAPKVVAGLTLGWEPKEMLAGLKVEAEWTHMGEYQEDDANTASYGGHDLLNLRGAYAVTGGIEVFGRVMNVLDTRWASSAQISSGAEQLVPGMPRTVFGGATVRF